jgi:RNA polymerase sigma-70 factor (ECF subfamily)
MVSIAYRMIGSVSEAEDIVQEAYLRVHRELRAGTQVESEQAYLTTVTTRLAIDHLRSARVRREEYFGPWLPEPLVDEVAPDMAEHADMADSLSMAFLVILETLSPVERAVFLLHDVFDYGYDEIAEIVDKSEPNCRQIAARARRRVDAGKPRFEVSRQRRDGLAEQFFAACGAGDVDGLVGLLAADAAFYGDGGGKGQGFPRPIFGRERVTKLLTGVFRKLDELGVRPHPVHVGGQPGALLMDPEQRLVAVWALDILDDRVQAIRGVVNPDKLGHLATTSELSRPSRERRASSDEGR